MFRCSTLFYDGLTPISLQSNEFLYGAWIGLLADLVLSRYKVIVVGSMSILCRAMIDANALQGMDQLQKSNEFL